MEEKKASALTENIIRNIDKASGKGSSDDFQLTVFTSGGEEFGVDINKVTEIIKVGAITRVPNAESYISGVINIRGRIDVIINLSKKLGLLEKEIDDKSRIIIIESENNKRGIIVDSVKEVMSAKKSSIQKPNSMISSKISNDYLFGVLIFNKRLIIMLDMNKVLEFSQI
jgi:purine-binding chemotaxis protein CheW